LFHHGPHAAKRYPGLRSLEEIGAIFRLIRRVSRGGRYREA